jgi:hypothetical protein
MEAAPSGAAPRRKIFEAPHGRRTIGDTPAQIVALPLSAGVLARHKLINPPVKMAALDSYDLNFPRARRRADLSDVFVLSEGPLLVVSAEASLAVKGRVAAVGIDLRRLFEA